MKNKLLTLALVIGLTVNAQWITTPQEDQFQFGVWTDVMSGINEETTPQIGAEFTFLMYWGWVSGGISYFDLTPSYTDIIAAGGVNIHLFNYNRIRYYAGPRIGIEFREGNGHPLAGAVLGFDWEATEHFIIGARIWGDYRSSQDNQFYGDDNAYEKGLILNNPMTTENSAVVISYKW